jgi:hypothetical protein
MDSRFTELRTKREQHKAERDLKRAERRADDPEQDGADVIDFAIDRAESAIIDATISSADADDLEIR